MNKKTQTALLTLIVANAAVFAVVAVCHIIDPETAGVLTGRLSLSSDAASLMYKPWSLLTYSFLSGNVLQLVFNMMWLYCFGRLLVMEYRPSNLYGLYVIGSLTGGVTFMAFNGVFSPAVSLLLGSSASVIAIGVAVAFLMPDRELYLPLLGEVKIKWIVAFVVLIFFVGLSAPNAGGNLAHLGGAAGGAAYAYVLKLRKRRALMSEHCLSEYRRLLEKIRTSGYDAMSKREKQRFFELSKYGRSDKKAQKA